MKPARRNQPAADETTDLELATLCKALAHPARVHILRRLLGTHVKTLREAGLIIGTADGPRTCLCVPPERLVRLVELLAQLHRR
jgi:ArsR family transcriptional regulator